MRKSWSRTSSSCERMVANRFSPRPYFAGLFRGLQAPCGVAINSWERHGSTPQKCAQPWIIHRPIFWCLVDPPKTCSFVGLIKLCHLLTGLFSDAVDTFASLFYFFSFILTGESTSKADKFDNFCRQISCLLNKKALGSALREMSKPKGVNLEGLGGSDEAPTTKIYRCASSQQRPRTRSCHESERLV